jgi:hypothetical protein
MMAIPDSVCRKVPVSCITVNYNWKNPPESSEKADRIAGEGAKIRI